MSTIITEPTAAHELPCPAWCQLPTNHGFEGEASNREAYNGCETRIHGRNVEVPAHDQTDRVSFQVFCEEFWDDNTLVATGPLQVSLEAAGAVLDRDQLIAISTAAVQAAEALATIERGESL